MGPDLRFAHELADAADAITMARFRALDLRVETKPDLTPVTEADRAAEEAIRGLVARNGTARGVLGEEFGDDGADGALDRRPDRRHEELRPRGARVGDAARARARRTGRGGGCVGTRARRRWWAVRGEGAWANGEACRVSAVARIEDCAVSTTSAPHMPAGWADLAAQAWTSRALGDFWQHCLVAEGAVDVATDADAPRCGTTPRSSSSSRRPAAAAPPSRAAQATPGESFVSTNGAPP